MRILCAPDSFKETLSASEAADAMAAGVRSAGEAFDADICPVADGGEGTLDALCRAMGGVIHTATVTGPLGEAVEARFAIVPNEHLGIVELAEASGLALVPRDRRDPTKTTTFGTGDLIRHCADHGAATVIVCIGGSATCDGAAGLAQAIGTRFHDHDGKVITEPITGGMLSHIARVEPADTRPAIRIACDVTNPLAGPNGAAAVYGPQKGATPDQVRQLDAGLAHLAGLIDFDPETPGSGAAGGAGWGLQAMCGGMLERGIDLVLDAVRFDERCRSCDLVLTGEGRLDDQSTSGKATLGVAARAALLNTPTIAIVGSCGEGAEQCLQPHRPDGLLRAVDLSERFGRERAMTDAAACVTEAARRVAASFQADASP